MSRIKECFESRWKDGLLVEVDFSQLEVIGLALLSNDPVLKNDIRDGLDMHRLRAAELFKIPESAVTPAQRTLAKRLSFQLQYGAGAKSMSEKNGISLELAKQFISNYYKRYRRVAEWQEEVAAAVKASRVPSGTHTAMGYPRGEGVWESPTGRIYKFYEYDAPSWTHGAPPSFSPTEMKNYPIQGFATADVMALFRAKLLRELSKDKLLDSVLPINTVHDSVMFDVEDDNAFRRLCLVVASVADKLPMELEARWPKLCIDLPFHYTIKSGRRWSDL